MPPESSQGCFSANPARPTDSSNFRMGVVNRQLGIGIYSPRLDERGNSVRGILACSHLSEELGLHAFNFMNDGSAYLRSMMVGDS